MTKPPSTKETKFKEWTQAHFIYSRLLAAYGTKNPEVLVEDLCAMAGAHITVTPAIYVRGRVGFINKRLKRMDCGFKIAPGRVKRSFRLVSVA